jgi:hypothetical protein
MSIRIGRIGLGVTAAAATAALALVPATRAQAAGKQCQAIPPAVAKENAAAARLVRKLQGNTNFVSRVVTATPKIRRTVRFTGFGTVVVKAPKGTTAVAGTFTLRGNDRCAIVVQSAQVVLRQNAYVISFTAPGEQGNPGKLKVTLVGI